MREKNIQGVFNLESLMKRQLAALVHCVRRTALMRVTDMTGTMTKRIAGGIINASIIMKICLATIGNTVDTEKIRKNCWLS